jgi:hypothetical protein
MMLVCNKQDETSIYIPSDTTVALGTRAHASHRKPKGGIQMVKRIPNIDVHAEALRLIEKAPENCPKYWENELIRDILERGAIKIAYEMARAIAPDEDEEKKGGGKEGLQNAKLNKPFSSGGA